MEERTLMEFTDVFSSKGVRSGKNRAESWGKLMRARSWAQWGRVLLRNGSLQKFGGNVESESANEVQLGVLVIDIV